MIRRLDLGCGNEKRQGYIGVDNNPNAKAADIFWDLNEVPWPFEDNSIDEIVADHVLEHLENTLGFFNEVYRILKPGGKLILKVPHFSCAWLHPMHRRAFSTLLFSYFAPEAAERYGNWRFRVIDLRLNWHRPTRLLRQRPQIVRIVNFLINWLANIHPGLCERVWCYWVGGFEEIAFEVIKEEV